MGSAKAFLAGTVIGAGAMYYFDPRMGNRRRAMLEDQLRRLSRRTAEGLDAGLRDLGNRAEGTLHQVGSLVESGQWERNRQARGPGRSRGRTRQFNWSPGTRLVAATAGTALMANCVACRTPGAILLGTLGFGLFARSMSPGQGGILVEKTIEIDAPVAEVFEFFSHPENYPRISDVVTDVEVFGDGRFAKEMVIAGVPVRFEERFVCRKENELLKTESEPSSALQYSKQLKFERMGDRHTRLHLHFCYNPPGGIIGHAFATAFGFDPKSVLTELLMRAKFFLETGREPHDAAAHRKAKSQQPATAATGSRRAERRELAPRGPGAPTDDVRRPGMSEFESQSPWPPSPDIVPLPTETARHFPPAID